MTKLVSFLQFFEDKIFYNFLFGPNLIPLRYPINLFKGGTFLWVMFLMCYFNNYSTGMILYLILHGSYGWMWITKDVFFGDKSFNVKAKFGSIILCAVLLTFYWAIPVPLALGLSDNNLNTTRIILYSSIYVSGLILMMGSDYQKNKTLKIKKGLISTGFFARTRNPNYLGQILIYGSFCMTAGHWLGWYIFGLISCTLFTIRMLTKQKMSYEKKKGWDQYKIKSNMLLPKLTQFRVIDLTFYAILIGSLIYFEYDRYAHYSTSGINTQI